MPVAYSLSMGLSMLGADSGQWLLSEVVLVLMGVLGLPLPLSVLTSTSAVLQCCSGSTGATSVFENSSHDVSHGRGEVCGVNGIEICLMRLLSVSQWSLGGTGADLGVSWTCTFC